MAALVQALSRFSQMETETGAFKADLFKVIALFCGAGLLMSLIGASYGLDMSVGFF
jgi:hypothetical protein